jgi:BirA family biotin operon repressor/biotin-[acetyl-CoA-carboxylase] ligase
MNAMETLPIRNPFPGAACFLVKETESTMRDALDLARMGFPPGSLVASEFQTAGRGRFGERRWESEAGANLLFTIRLAPEAAALPALPLRIGAVLCQTVLIYAIRKNIPTAVQPLIKWPNDLLIHGRKAAGVVCESKPAGESAGLYAGIGVNCNQTAFPPSIAAASTSLAAELGAPIDRWLFLELFLDLLAHELLNVVWKDEVDKLLWRRGKRVRFLPGLSAANPATVGAQAARSTEPTSADENLAAPSPAAEAIEGLLEGVDDEGSLLLTLRGEGRSRSFASGELVLETEAS